jgi:hypothetical protein
MEPDPLCSKIEEEVHNMTEIDANRYFCEKSKTARELYDNEGAIFSTLGKVGLFGCQGRLS